MAKALILRGLPGSGKSSYVDKLVGRSNSNDYKIHSTDHYFFTKSGYRFDLTKLAEYHRNNLLAFEQSCRLGVPLVICDNTNLKTQHIESYVQAAAKHNYQIEILQVGLVRNQNLIKLYCARNIHNVAEDVIQKMASSVTPFLSK